MKLTKILICLLIFWTGTLSASPYFSFKKYQVEGFFVKFGGTSSIVNKESWLSVVYFLPYCTSAFLAL